MMRRQTLGCVALAVTLAVGFAAPAAAQDAKAAEVLAKTRKALGDRKLEALKSLSLEAALQRNVGDRQLTSEIEILIEMPDKYVRIDTPSGAMGLQLSMGFNGDKGIMPGGGNMSMGPGGAMVFRMGGGSAAPEGPKPTPEQLAQMSRAQVRTQRTEISRLMLGWFGMVHPALPVQYTYAGEAESPDGKAHVIDVKDTEGFAARLFIDQNNYLPLMVTYQGRQPRMITSTVGPGGAAPRNAAHGAEQDVQKMLAEQPPVEFSLFFDDWREVDGIQFPHVMRRASAGTTNEEWAISKVKVNPKIDAKKFAVETK